MRSHFVAATAMLGALTHGDLDNYRASATVIAAEGEHGPPFSRSTAVRDAATRAREAATIREAADAAAHLGATCGECHRKEGGPHVAVGTPPASVASGSLRMARHRWAAERMWQGLYEPSDVAWQAGCGVFVDAPLITDTPSSNDPIAKKVGVFTLAARAHAIAQDAADATSTSDRKRLFADLYETCAGCHQLALHP